MQQLDVVFLEKTKNVSKLGCLKTFFNSLNSLSATTLLLPI
jgi:hypothetical protein